jgi:enterobacterial common antigen flippase
MAEDANSYRQIFRSSSILGGVQALNYLIGMVRIKAIALLIGPEGVGLFGLYTSALAFVAVFTDFGLTPSAVREIARANKEGDLDAVSRSVIILRRVFWILGALGWAATALFSRQISELTTGSSNHAPALAALGVILLLSSVNIGYFSLLQGMRRIGDFARAQLIGTILGCLLVILIIFIFGERGIAPAMIAATLAGLVCTYWFARGVKLRSQAVSLHETWIEFRSIVLRLGLAFTWSSLLIAGLDVFLRSYITRDFGIDQAGNYQAASAVSGVLGNLVIAAMSTDFYPRLVSVVDDKDRATQIINRQTEIGVLLALPGLSVACAFAPLVTLIFYSHKFTTAAEMLPWMAVGVFFRVAAWPMWYTQLAKGASAWFAGTQTLIVGVQAALTIGFVHAFGVVGAAYAIALSAFCNIFIQTYVMKILIGGGWRVETKNLVITGATLLGGAICSRLFLDGFFADICGAAACAAASVYSLREIAARLGEHRVVSILRKMPGVSLLLLGVSSGHL